MALQKLTLRPGVNREGTNYSNEGGFYSCDKIRFRSGYAEKIGGWINIGGYTYEGIARSLWAWASLTAESLLGLGTTQKFYIEYGTQYYDITPISTYGAVASPYFETISGSLQVKVNYTNHNLTPGTFITFTKAYTTLSTAINSLTTTTLTLTSTTGFPTSGTNYILINNEQISYTGIAGSTLTGVIRGVNSTVATSHDLGATIISLEAITVGGANFAGEFQVSNVDNASYFYIIANSIVTSTATGGSGTYAISQLNASSGVFSALSGWGSGGWGKSGWGAGTVVTSTSPIRLWSQTNYDQDLIFAQRYGAIYWWTKNTESFPRAITINEQANAQVTSTTAKVVTTATWLNGATDITVDDNTGINSGSVIADGLGIVSGTYVTTSYAGGLIVPLSQATVSVAATTTTTLLPNSSILPQTVTLASVTGYPTQGVIQVGSEKISYNGIAGNTLTITARGYDSSTVAIHAIGSAVTFYATLNATVYFSYAGRHIPVETLVVTTSSSNAFTIAFGATPYDPYNFSDADNFDPLLIRWSDQDNPFEWVPEVTNQSGEQRLANGSVIVAVANTRQEILVWTDTALYSMQYLGPPYVFGINLLMDNLSIAAQNAAITVNNVTYWMGVDRFYQYSGRVETLPCTLRQFVFGNINRSQLAQICCGTNEGFNEIWWFYPSADSAFNNRYVIYNHLEDTWYYGTMNRTTWLDTQLEQNPLGAFSTEKTYLTSAITDTQTDIAVKDASSFPESGSFTITAPIGTYTTSQLVTYDVITFIEGGYGADYFGIAVGTPYTCTTTSVSGTVILSYYDAIDEAWYIYLSNNVGMNGVANFEFQVGDISQIITYTGKLNNTFTGCTHLAPKYSTQYSIVSYIIPNQLMFHEYGYDDGALPTAAPIEAYIESSDFDIGDGLNFAYVWRILPDLTFSGSTVSAPKCQLTVKVRQNSGAAYTAHSTDTQTVTREATYPVEQYTGQVYCRVRGRQMSFRMASEDLGVFWQMGLMRIDVRQDGRR